MLSAGCLYLPILLGLLRQLLLKRNSFLLIFRSGDSFCVGYFVQLVPHLTASRIKIPALQFACLAIAATRAIFVEIVPYLPTKSL
jgi:hypothetical protein